MSCILVIDDEPGIREVLKDILEDEGYAVLTAEDGLEGLTKLKQHLVDLVILDVWLPKMGGIEVLESIKAQYRDTEVIIISGHANIDMAVKAIKIGAFDMMEKPLSMDKVLTQVRNALTVDALKKENQLLKESLQGGDKILGSTPQILQIQELISQAGPTNATVFITGENGTGKELVARQIHFQSPRKKGPFVAVNCAAIPDNLIESELFGHEKGSFTGAVSRKRGKFEIASGGTLFLDEIADLSLSAQAKILRAIQELTIERVGGEESIQVDIRLIAATNKNMKDQISSGLFREDLFYRLHVVPISMPSLKDRKDDIPLLAEHFLQLFCVQLLGKKPEQVYRLSEEGIKILQGFIWPGNIRQFKNVIQRIVVFAEGPEITMDDVEAALVEERRDQNRSLQDFGSLGELFSLGLNEARDQFEKKFILQKLRESDFVITKAATAMGVYPSNLHGKMKKFGIEKDSQSSHVET